MEPLWGVGDEPGDFVGYLAEQVGVDREDVLSWDVMTHPIQPSTRLGRARELIAAPRLDNLATSYAGVRALLDAVATEPAHVPVLVLFDHEEIGSTSERGATSTLLPSVLERIVTAGGGNRDDYWRALAATVIASGDMGTRRTPTTPIATSRSTRSSSTAARCSRSTPTCATPRTPSAPRRSGWPASRPVSRCRPSSPAATCRAARPSVP